MRFAPLLLAVLAAPAVWSQTAGSAGLHAQAGARVLESCIETIDADVSGLQQIEAACPGFEQAVRDLGHEPFLSDATLENLSLEGVDGLQRLTRRYNERPAGVGGIETAALAPILKSIEHERQSERPLTWFERFKNWLRNLLDRQSSDSSDWLIRWLDDLQISEVIMRSIVYGLVIVVILLGLGVVINELRVAGVFRRGRAAGSAASGGGVAAGGAAQPGLADLDAADPRERPSLLLRILIATLVKTGRLRAERSLTHRELARRASFDHVGERECFQSVAKLAECVVYGGQRVSLHEAEPVLQAGRALNAKLTQAQA